MTAPGEPVCALATPPGHGAVAVVRVTGLGCLRLLDPAFRPGKPSRQPAGTARVGWFLGPDREELDRVVLTVFRAPNSYTGEDLAEISCHGGSEPARAILRRLGELGFRPAGPGEFTRRAVENGKMTLSQAEGTRALIEADSPAAARNALRQYRGDLSDRIEELAEELRTLVATSEHHLAMDEGDAPRPAGLRRASRGIVGRLDRLIRRGRRTRLLHEGAYLPIIGRPNVGKSSIFNRLLERERSVVNPVSGTTRDRVEAKLVLADVPTTVADTSGITARPRTPLARAAVRQTLEAVRRADLVVAVFDGSRSDTAADARVLAETGDRPVICVINKTDRPRRLSARFLNGHRRVELSALRDPDFGRLRREIARRLRVRNPSPASGTRHLEALESCRDALRRSLDAPDADRASFELRAALDALAGIDELTSDRDILDRVFSRFCVGK